MANGLSDIVLRRARWEGTDRWLSDGGSRGIGRLVAKVSQAGIGFYFAYFNAARQRRFLSLGKYDAAGQRGITLKDARDRAAARSRQYRDGDTELHERIEHDKQVEIMARRAARAAAEHDEQEAKVSSIRELLEVYVRYLEREGKQATADVRRIFQAHVFDAWPALSLRRASEVGVDELVALLGRLTEAGKGRTAAKLRSYLRAAYALAIRAKTDPDVPFALRGFGITANPVASIGALSKYSRVRDRVLTVNELRDFYRRLCALPETVGRDAVHLCLLLGGQRPAQLLRVTPTEVDLEGRTLALFDPKGARKQARRHVLPIPNTAVEILKRLKGRTASCRYLFSTDGTRATRQETVSAVAAKVCDAMLRAGEAHERFELRDLRRTCETMLAALGVSSDVRAQLQSHGLGGVQYRHYDRHDYLAEKRAALELWERRLWEIAASPLPRVLVAS
jgi:integrase